MPVVLVVSATVLTASGQNGHHEPLSASAASERELRGLEEMRREAAGDASRSSERTPEPAPAPDAETAQATPTIVPPQRSGKDEPSVDPESGDGSSDAKQPESALPGGFAPVPGCTAVVPDEGSVANGQLGSAHLCDVGDGYLLRPDAGAAFLALAKQYESSTGESLAGCIGNTYRSYDEQVELYEQKPSLAAEPGTSEHGWGLAMDFECGASSYSSAFYSWLDAHGREYGWVNPPWAQPGGSRPEPWHWEFHADVLS